jgi:exonuclease 3'-5' domain-containing protein 1
MTSLEMITTRELGQLELSEPGAQNTWPSTRTVMVDTSATLKSLVDTLKTLEKSSGSIYMDLEGVKLSRLGSISIIQILIPSCEQVFIVDIHTLGKTAFDSLDSGGNSLKDALESDSIKKYLFDVRNDSDALYALFGVRLANVVDIQLLELASREGPKHAVCGLAKCIEQEQALSPLALLEWQSTKKDVVKMFDPERGGTYEVFNARPLPQVLIEYCVGDVAFLPLLSTIYQNRLDCHWSEKVRVETEKRLEESRSPGYKPHGRQKSLGPKQWRYPPREETKSESTTRTTASAFKKQKSIATLAAPVPRDEEQSTATVPAPATKEKEKSAPVAACPAPKKEKKPTTTVATSTPKKVRKPTATVGGTAPKKENKPSAAVGGSASKKRDRPSSAPTPNKGGESTATASAPASGKGEGKGKEPIATVAAPAPKKEEKQPQIISALVLWEEKKSIAAAGSFAPKKGKKPTMTASASAPKKGEKPNEVVAASASKKEKNPTTAAASAPKKGKSTAAVVVSAISSVPAPLASQKVLIQPTVSGTRISA